jgi:hypothetical protein
MKRIVAEFIDRISPFSAEFMESEAKLSVSVWFIDETFKRALPCRTNLKPSNGTQTITS